MQKATALLSALFLTTACTEAIPEFFGDASSALAPQTSNKEISVFNETVVVSGSVNSAAINIEADLGGGYMNISAIDGGADIDFSDGNFSFSFDPSVYLSTVQGVESSHPGLLLRAEFLVDGVSTWSSDNNFTVDYVRPRVNFSLANSNAGEDDGTHTVNVTLDKASSMALSVNYNNTDNSATSGADYTGGSGTINFTIGQTSGSFNITLSPDVIGELDEDFDINFSAPSAELAIGVVHPTHNLTINENDAPTVHFNTTTDSGTEGDGATSVQVDLSNQADYPIIVNYSVMGDSTAPPERTIPEPLAILLSLLSTR